MAHGICPLVHTFDTVTTRVVVAGSGVVAGAPVVTETLIVLAVPDAGVVTAGGVDP